LPTTSDKFIAGIAARFTGGMDWPGSLMIGFGMLKRVSQKWAPVLGDTL